MRVFLTGGTGMVGGAIKRLSTDNVEIVAPSHKDLDLTDPNALRSFLKNEQFDLAIHAAAKVGGIKANNGNMAAFLTENMMIGMNVINEAANAGIKSMINFGSSCMYPRDFTSPLKENDILKAPLEPTNEGYALAKISAARLCSYLSKERNLNYKTLIPCNLYGPNDNFDPEAAHMMPAAILKIKKAIESNAATVEIWGDGTARREFVYVDDVANFVWEIADKIETIPPVLNIGAGYDISINDCYKTIAETLGFNGNFTHKLDAPKGMSHKLMDSGLATQYGWTPQTDLKNGILKTAKSLSH